MTYRFSAILLKSVAVIALTAVSYSGLSFNSMAEGRPSESVLDTPADAELLGDYLAGTYANLLEDAQARSEYFTKAYKASPSDVRLGRRAITAAVTAGDFDLATKLSKELYKTEKNESMALTVLAIDAFARGRHKQARRYLKPDTADISMGIVMAFTQGWNEVALGNEDKAKEIFEGQKARAYFGDLGALQIAKMAALSEDYETAAPLFEALREPTQAIMESTLSSIRFYAASGQIEKAAEIANAYVDDANIESGPITTYAKALNAGRSIDKPLKPNQQLSLSLTDPAYEFFLRNRAADAAEVYLRFALQVDSKNEKAQLWLARLLEETDRADDAMAIYQSFADSSPYIISARLSEANIYFDRDEDDKALKVLEDVNAKHETFVTREALGRARFIREKFAEALPIYTAIIESMSEEELAKNTQPLYLRGIGYERTEQWKKAEDDFLRVLEIEPDNSDALNYLGYTWVDRGENLTEAFDMIRKAVALEPDSGAIIDSLGWAHFKLGEYKEAKVQLEKAVELSPSSATIIDHLGDVYWKLGRYREAGYQWERALIYDPTDEERTRIQQKLETGLPSVSSAQ